MTYSNPVTKKINSSNQSSKKKSVGEICQSCKKTFIRIKSHKCKGSETSKNVVDKIQLNNNANSSQECKASALTSDNETSLNSSQQVISLKLNTFR